MTRTSSSLPLWDRILFESPELASDIIFELKNKIKSWKTALLRFLINHLE
jgi:hypothetical protein